MQNTKKQMVAAATPSPFRGTAQTSLRRAPANARSIKLDVFTGAAFMVPINGRATSSNARVRAGIRPRILKLAGLPLVVAAVLLGVIGCHKGDTNRPALPLTTERFTNAFNGIVIAINEVLQANDRQALVLSNSVAELSTALTNTQRRLAEMEAQNRQLRDQNGEMAKSLVKAETTATLLSQEVAQQRTLLNSASERRASPGQNLRTKK